MALILNNCVLNNGLALTGVYVRIDSISGNKENISMRLTYHLNQDAAKSNMSPLQVMDFNFQPDLSNDASNYHKQGYESLKKMDVFANAVDVFEEVGN